MISFDAPVQPTASQPRRVLGLDVAKAHVVIFDSVSGSTHAVPNTPAALLKALRPFKAYDLVVCETTGGYERAALDACARLALACARADAARIKAYIRSHGGKAKTDAIDARWIAAYAIERGETLPRWTPPCREEEACRALVSLRQDTLASRTQAKNRRAAPGVEGRVRKALDRQIAFFDAEIERLDAEIEAAGERIAGRAEEEAVLRALPGVGPVVARTLLALMPELGRLSRRAIASLAGLAPDPCESGDYVGRRRTGYGRRGIKPVLFMAALAAARRHPALAPAYKRLVAAGKPKRLALAAIARRLLVIANAVIRDHRAAQLT